MLQLRRGDAAAARAAAQQAVEADAQLPIARAALSRALVAGGAELDRAIALAREAHAAHPYDPDFAWALGAAHLKRGQAKTAFESLRPALGGYSPARPGYAELAWDAAQALDRDGRRDSAQLAANIALSSVLGRKPEPAWIERARAIALGRAPRPEQTASAPAPAEAQDGTPAAPPDAAKAEAAEAPPAETAATASPPSAPAVEAPTATEPPARP
jgi:tetratricopeptide (TPR) repeat protein